MSSVVVAAEPVLCQIIIPVYNALSQTARCIESVLKYTTSPYTLILVNDGSDWATTSWLRETAAANDHVVLLENSENRGFLHSANRGLAYDLEDEKSSGFLFKLILNSDTLVSDGWIEAFERCFLSDERIGLATAVSNNAENISIPIPEGYNVRSMARLTAEKGADLGYPDVTTAVGFCMAIRTSLLRSIGLFDEAFSPGYGEESDYHFKVLCRGFRSVVVSDCFVYHENHASFSGNKAAIVSRNRPVFDSRWRVIYHNELNEEAAKGDIASLKLISDEGSRKEKKHDILFLIPTAKLFGGIVVVYEICRRLIERGIDANAVVLGPTEEVPPDLPFMPYFRPNNSWAAGDIPQAKAYVATHYETSPYAFMAYLQNPSSTLAYLVQGYEPWFPGAAIHEVVHTLRAIPNRIAVSKWLHTMLARWDIDATVIPNGVDTRYFYPASPDPAARLSKDRLTLFTLLRDDPQAGTALAAKVLQRVKTTIPGIRIITVGNLSSHPPFDTLVEEAIPSASRREMRDIYRRSDIFVDFSMVQGFGLMGLEAMASGVAAVLSATGGAEEYASSACAVLVPPGSEDGFVDAIMDLARNPRKIADLKTEGLRTAAAFDWRKRIDGHADFFESLLSKNNEITSEHREHMLRYLFGRLLRGLMTRSSVTEAQNHLNHALESSCPAGALEILGHSLSTGDLELIQTTHEGVSIIRLFEKARLALARETATPGHPGGSGDIVSIMEGILSGNQL